MINYVIDASLAVKWLVPESDSDKAFDLLEQAELRLCAPDFLFAEAGNAIYKRVKTGALLPAEAKGLIDKLGNLGISPVLSTPALLQSALAIAQTIEHNAIYDCLYLAVAEQLGYLLLTADRHFSRKIIGTPWAEWLAPWQ